MRQRSRTIQIIEYTMDYYSDNRAYHWLYDGVYNRVYDKIDEVIVSLLLYSIQLLYNDCSTTIT